MSPWNARFSILLVPGKYSYALGQQPSWRVPPYFPQVAYASPLRMREDWSQRQPIKGDYKGLQLLQSGRRGGACWPDWIILHTQWGSFSSRHRLRYSALLLELKDRNGVVGYTVEIFSAHFVAVKCEVFTTSNTMEIQLCARPATKLTHSPTSDKSRTPVYCACAKI